MSVVTFNGKPCFQKQFADIDPRAVYVIKKVAPSLHDLRLYFTASTPPVYVDTDFFFIDDPNLNVVGYTGSCLEEFNPDSDTYNALATIINILFAEFGLVESKE